MVLTVEVILPDEEVENIETRSVNALIIPHEAELLTRASGFAIVGSTGILKLHKKGIN